VLCQDVSESVRAKHALEESEQKFRLMANSLPIVLWTATPEGKLDYISEQWEDYYGNPISESLGDGWAGFIHADDVAAAAASWQYALASGTTYETEFRVRHKSGNYRCVLVRAVPIRNDRDEIISWYGSNTDIEDKKQIERAIKESETQFRTLAEALPQLVWMQDAAGKLQYASRSWERYSGIADSDAAWKWMVHPDDWELVMKVWTDHFSVAQPFRQEVRLRNRDGAYRWFYSISEPVKDEKGEVLRWVGALTDIHSQKTFTEALERQVADRTQELAEANEELSRSNEDLQQFAHVASHDLKEPVRKIMTFTQLLRSTDGAALSERGKMSLEKIRSASQRMMDMVDGVLVYSKFAATDQVYRTIDLEEIVRSAEADLELLIDQKGAKIVTQGLSDIWGAPVLIHQLFYNLINNALKFSKENLAPLISINGEQAANGLVRITVADNGIGFEQQYADSIFKTFTRLNSKDNYEGTGLGLSLCKRIVERHNGTIWAEGKAGVGARIIMELPRLA
jgi:hypothetical protein